uniref:Uncharacterized protein n=1 Tax=Salix viminalis TaxID=40686 RepID=A0A6N2KMB1_SALVM
MVILTLLCSGPSILSRLISSHLSNHPLLSARRRRRLSSIFNSPLPQLGVIQSLLPLHSIVSSAKPVPSLGQCLPGKVLVKN